MRKIHQPKKNFKKYSPHNCGFSIFPRFVIDKTAANELTFQMRRRSIVGKINSEGAKLYCIVAVVLAVMGMFSVSFGAENQIPRQYEFSIPEQAVADALNQFSEQTGAVLLFPYDLVEGRTASAVFGQYELTEALEILLEGSGLSGGLVQSEVIRVSLGNDKSITDREENSMASGKIKTGLLASASALLFGVGGAALAQDSAGDNGAKGARDTIIVTATKRETSLQDTPMSLSVLSSDAIDKKGLVSMDDYLRNLPSVNILEQGAARKNPIIIRGVTASPQNDAAAVGIYFDEVSLTGSSAASAGTSWIGSPDIKLVDIERVEVLRGPQGTLYGAGSLTGTVRIIPATPNLSDFEASVTLGHSNTAELGGDNFVSKGMINLPLIDDKLALRAVAYRYTNSGFVENIAGDVARNDSKTAFGYSASVGATAVNVDDIGENSFTGGRATLEWRPIDKFGAVLTYMRQKTEQLGLPEVELGLGTFQQARISPQSALITNDLTDRLGSEVEIGNAKLTYDLGWAEVLSSTSRLNSDGLMARDVTNGLLFGPSRQQITAEVDTFAQEVRLTSDLSGPLQFILGGYYEEVDWHTLGEQYWTGDPSLDTNIVPGFDPYASWPAFPELNPFSPGDVFEPNYYTAVRVDEIDQKAIFGEVSYDILDNLTATFGGRAFWYTRGFTAAQVLPLFSSNTSSQDSRKDTDQTYKANLTYEPYDDVLLYGQFSQGFRLGRIVDDNVSIRCDQSNGPNTIISVVTGEVVEHEGGLQKSDTLNNYEIGGKFTLLDKRLTVNVAAFHLDWKGIPITIFGFDTEGGTTSCLAQATLGEAQSQGFEFETTYQVTDNLYTEFGISYNDAKLSADSGALGDKGDRLPGSAQVNVNAAAQYDFGLFDRPAFVRGDYAYVGGFYNNLQQLGTKAGDYHQVGMRAGIEFGNVGLDVFVQNLTNSDALTFVNAVVARDQRAYRLRPRTVGVQLTWAY